MREPASLRLCKTYREKIIGAPLSSHEERLMKEAFHTGAMATCRVFTHSERQGDTERMAKNTEEARRRFRN